MSWIIIASFGPILWALTNHIDKYLLVKYGGKKGEHIGSLMLFSTLYSLVVLPIFIIIKPEILNFTEQRFELLILSGVLYATFTFFYLKALSLDEVSIVMPIFQLVPLFGYFFGYLFLGETLTLLQIVGSITILFFCLIILLDFDGENGLKFKWSILVLTVLSLIFYSLSETIFKYGTVNDDFLFSLFWNHVGILLFGIVLLFSNKSRQNFIAVFKRRVLNVISLNISGETLTFLGDMATRFALLSAPVALVFAVSSTQPVFVLVFGVILSLIAPKIYRENISKKALLFKSISIIGIILGTLLLV